MSGKTPLGSDFDFHGNALDRIFETYAHLRDKCPVGYSGKHGGFAETQDKVIAEPADWNHWVTPMAPAGDLPPTRRCARMR